MPDPIDPNAGQEDPQGQPEAQPDGNEAGASEPQATPTEIVIGEHKTTLDELRKIEALKPIFDDHDNRAKWQAENTRRAQEIAEIRRDAEMFRRMKSDPRFQNQHDGRPQPPTNSPEAKKRAYVQSKMQAFPDVDPRFFESQFDDMMEFAGQRAQETMTPILQQQSEDWERRFLGDHPLIEKGSDKYYKIAELVGKGYDPEHAYNVVYSDELALKRVDEEIKKRDEAAKKKILQSRSTNSQSSSKPVSEDEAFERAWSKYGR